MKTSKAAAGKTILIAPAAFKGTLSAQAAAAVMQEALLEAANRENSVLQLNVCPIADGGDDTLSVLQASDPGFEVHTVEVTGPVPEMRVQAEYLIHPTRKLAVIEAAQAHGLKRLAGRAAQTSHPAQRALAPMVATSYGVGELIRAAIETAKRAGLALETLVITVGGSASTEGGVGALQALGACFFDAAGELISAPVGGGDLARIQAVIWPETWFSGPLADEPHIGQTNRPASKIESFKGKILIATDVTSPLLGPEGTAAVFAPQKGANPAQCAALEAGLTHVERLLRATTGPAESDRTASGKTGTRPAKAASHQDEETSLTLAQAPGAGAAGGLGWGLRHLPESGFVSGAGWIAEALGLDTRIQAADVIFTGEGRLDATSLAGKGTGQLLHLAEGKPVWVFCGQAQTGFPLPENVYVFPLAETPQEALQAMRDPEASLRKRVMEALLGEPFPSSILPHP